MAHCLLIHRMTSCEFLPRYGNGRGTRRSLLLRTDSCYVPSPWLLSHNCLLRSWPKHNYLVWLLNLLVNAPSTGELLYRIWTTATSCEGPGGRQRMWPEGAARFTETFGWLSIKNVRLPAYSTWIAWGGRRGGGKVHRTDVFRALIFYSSAVFLTHAPM
jgi:hypothetical protein